MEVGNFSLYWDLGFADLISSTSFVHKDYRLDPELTDRC